MRLPERRQWFRMAACPQCYLPEMLRITLQAGAQHCRRVIPDLPAAADKIGNPESEINCLPFFASPAFVAKGFTTAE